jgi:cellulose biosynthesis protein BcsQ
MILVTANAKGGAGKTTTAVGLAGEGARRGFKVLAIDGDTQGNLTEHLIGKGDPLEPQGDGGKGLRRLMIDGDALVPVCVREKSENGGLLDVIPAGHHTQSLADDLSRALTRSLDLKIEALRGLRETLHEATAQYDLVFIARRSSMRW